MFIKYYFVYFIIHLYLLFTEPSDTKIESIIDYFKIYKAYTQTGKVRLVRIGRDYDGGYVVPEYALSVSDALFGYGISTDASFEEHFSKIYKKPSYGFDCGSKYVSKHPLFTFISECLGDDSTLYRSQNSSKKFSSYSTQLDNLGLKNKNVFIKMDIESGEYMVLHDILKYHSNDITGIALELHLTNFTKALDLLAALSKQFCLVHLHCNNYDPKHTFTAKNSIGKISKLVELSYININLLSHYYISNNQKHPTAHDMQNLLRNPELEHEILPGFTLVNDNIIQNINNINICYIGCITYLNIVKYIFKISFPNANITSYNYIKCDFLLYNIRQGCDKNLSIEKLPYKIPYIIISGIHYPHNDIFYKPIFTITNSNGISIDSDFINIPLIVPYYNNVISKHFPSGTTYQMENDLNNGNTPNIRNYLYNKNHLSSVIFPSGALAPDGKIMSTTYPMKDDLKKNFLFYCTFNCIPERDNIFNKLMEMDNTYTSHSVCKCNNNYNNTLITDLNFHSSNINLSVFLKKAKNYTFILCPESKKQNGYVTEKILNAFLTGNIPVYYGDTEWVKTYFNPKAFIAIDDFPTVDKLGEHLKYLYNNVTALEEIYNEPIFKNGIIPSIFELNNTSLPAEPYKRASEIIRLYVKKYDLL